MRELRELKRNISIRIGRQVSPSLKFSVVRLYPLTFDGDSSRAMYRAPLHFPIYIICSRFSSSVRPSQPEKNSKRFYKFSPSVINNPFFLSIFFLFYFCLLLATLRVAPAHNHRRVRVCDGMSHLLCRFFEGCKAGPGSTARHSSRCSRIRPDITAAAGCTASERISYTSAIVYGATTIDQLGCGGASPTCRQPRTGRIVINTLFLDY